MKLMTAFVLPLAAAFLIGGGMKPPISTAADEIAESLPKEVEEYADRDSEGLLLGMEELCRRRLLSFLKSWGPLSAEGR